MKKIVDYIEDKNTTIDKDWYYHAMPFSSNNYENVLTKGILSPYLLQNHSSSYRYIFVSRANKDSQYDAFYNYSIYPSFIINNNISTIKAEDSYIKKLILGRFHIAKFTSLYKDEYQVYKIIKEQEIIGILYNLKKLITDNEEKANYYFKNIYDLIVLLSKLNITIPIIDYYSEKEINKQKVLSLIKENKIINNN